MLKSKFLDLLHNNFITRIFFVDNKNVNKDVPDKPQTNYIADKRYKIIKKIDKGSFGKVYLGEKVEDGLKVAIKVEVPTQYRSTLLNEFKIYHTLNNARGFPKVYYYGTERNRHILIMDLLGPSLQDMFVFCGNKFTMKTLLFLLDQMLERVEYIHSKNLIHRDLKPANFLMGIEGQRNTVYLVDFGLSKFYYETMKPTYCNAKKQFVGTIRFASINSYIIGTQTRRDDLEAIAYIILYFYHGKLPWQGISASTAREKYEKVTEVKLATSIAMLCRGLPHEFATYLNYCRNLKFNAKPDYMYLRHLFQKLFIQLNYDYDYSFDWLIQNDLRSTARNVYNHTMTKIENHDETKKCI